MHSYTPILIACIFHGLDILTGFVSCIKRHDIKSSKMRDGLFKKVGFLFCYALAWTVDKYGYIIGISIGIRILPAVVLYSVITEIVSILENISEINPDLPENKLLSLFHINQKDGEE